MRTYISRYPMHSLSRKVNGRNVAINFYHGSYSSDDLEVQKFIESSHAFKRGEIYLKPIPTPAVELEIPKKKWWWPW